jgi:hypothetical protein
MIVRFYELTQKAEFRTIGDIRLDKDRLVADPPDSEDLQRLLAEPVGVYHEDKPLEYVDPNEVPEKFLKGCVATFHGSYFWCKEVED